MTNFKKSEGLTFSTNISDEVFLKATESTVFRKWKNKVVDNFDVSEIIIHNVFMFGSRVGFIIVEAKATLNGKFVPGIAMLRGDSVSIMPVLKCNGKEYTTLVVEPRIPVGNPKLPALPAGMVDNDTVQCAAIKELGEEIGTDIDIDESKLIDLGKYPLSAGGCDENIQLYAFEYNITQDQLDSLDNRQNGVGTENEQITVKVIDFDSVPNIQGIDARSVLSYYLWKNKNV